MKKKLSVAFLWHMHQPVYQESYESIFFMPWTRLHAVKDYLDMLFQTDNFPNLKLNFNLSPVILDAFIKYADGYDDIHSSLTVKPVEELTKEDKLFILNYFFDANYKTMIMKHSGYDELYKKRNAMTETKVEDFSLQEYSDIMFLFNLAWMDSIWLENYPKLKKLSKKKRGFTLKDRQYIIEIQRDIISKIIPSYKKYQDEGKVEVSTNPLYHPIMPLLTDISVAQDPTSQFEMPKGNFDFKEDAKIQVDKAISFYESLFGRKPKGMWASELSVSDDVMNIFSNSGIKWTVADESILSNTLNKDFVRDNIGNLEDPYDLSKVYTFKNSTSDENIGIFFRNAVFANLIGFEYPRYDSAQAANDLYDRIKTIQDKLQSSPDAEHIIVIAMDGENSWENYENDGNDFLQNIYNLICSDETLETVLLSDYYEKADKSKVLKSISPGTILDKNFQLWISEPIKNKAWEYLDKVRTDIINFENTISDEEIKKSIWRELFVVEGSDWFWWFGEPNDSGQDNLFDYLFRKHLQNVYLLADKPVPDFLDKPLTMLVNAPSRYPKAQISTKISGMGDSDEWRKAGCIDIPSGPLTDNNRILTKICYGVDYDKLYLRMDINHYNFEHKINDGIFYQIYLYIKNRTLSKSTEGKIRLVMKPETLTPILKETFSNEIKLTFAKDKLCPVEVAYSNKEGLWFSTLKNNVKYALKNVLEIEIPLDDIGVKPTDIADFIVVDGVFGNAEGLYPHDVFLTIEREKKTDLIYN